MALTKQAEMLWPRAFRMDPALAASASSRTRYWNHELYRGSEGQPVQVFYSCTRQQSEENAKKFLGDKVLGFDMEWVPGLRDEAAAPLKHRISLIQIASEDKIALFHLGRHSGNTPDDLIAPSLRAIIESADITKAGVNIMGADVSRLRKWFDVQPRGVFELSHLHNLVTFGGSDPSKCTKKTYKLSDHVETHLGLPFYKGDVRMSFCGSHLDQEQQKYAAADAYAGYMLYHCMNAKRAAMLPKPPLPIFADEYPDKGPLRLRLDDGVDGTVTALAFFRPPATPEDNDGERTSSSSVLDGTVSLEQKSRRRAGRVSSSSEHQNVAASDDLVDDEQSSQLFSLLRAHRKTEASKRRCSAFIIASDTVLRNISRRRPKSETDLLEIRGVGGKKVTEYGSAWLSIIGNFVQETDRGDEQDAVLNVRLPTTYTTPGDQYHDVDDPSKDISPVSESKASRRAPASGSQVPRTLSTGLSFGMDQVNLLEGTVDSQDGHHSITSPGSTPNFTEREPSPSTLKRKREHAERLLEESTARAVEVE